MRFPKPNLPGASGFALVATLMLMVLLAILAIGLLGLSAVTLRTTGHGSAQAEARANARMALMVALGELQKHAGPDTRVTAPSGIVDESAAPLTGVWKSWEGTDHETTGRPVPPVYVEKTRTESEGGRFLAWLVSGEASDPENPAALASGTPVANTVPLLSGGTLGEGGEGQVHVVPQARDDGSGAFAWWVSGENQKARLPKPYQPDDAHSPAQWSDLAKSHSVADPETLGLDRENPQYIAKAEKAVTLATADFLPVIAAAKPPRESFHDLSVSSVGLLTNTATGGWRKDLSLLTENWENLLSDGLPLFRITPLAGDTSEVARPTAGVSGNALGSQSLLYPWLSYGMLNQAPVNTQYTANASGAVSSWENLVNYATAYRRKISASGDGNGAMPHSWTMIDNSNAGNPVTNQHRYDYLHTLRTAPVIARIQWVFSHRTTRNDNGTAATADDTYPLKLLITPVVTLWNPYNVTVSSPPDGLRIRFAKPPPCALIYHNRDGVPVAGRKMHQGSNTGNVAAFVQNYPASLYTGASSFEYNINTMPPLLPGETRVFSPSGLATGMTVSMTAGYNPNGGFQRDINFIGTAHRGTDTVKLGVRFDNMMNFQVPGHCGVFLDLLHTNNANLVYQRYLMRVPLATAQAYWPELPAAELPSPDAASIEGTDWKPFFSMVFGARLSSDSSFPTKGLVQNNPHISLTQTHGSVQASAHPANNSFDYSFFPHALGGDDRTPNANNANQRGFIISGFQSGTGLSRAILSEIPLRPMASLGELQNWDLRGQNPYPPFQLNLIGNADANPLIAPNAVFRATGGHDSIHHDDAYCANHLLFDDWFLSSIAPEPGGFGQAIDTSQRDRLKDFLMDHAEKPLVNRGYLPISGDRNLTEPKAIQLADEILGDYDGWRRVASRLEVEGMFNVNSTSVTAWRALLGHARDQKIPHYAEGGVNLSARTDHAFSRFAVAGDSETGKPGGISGGFPESTEFTGYRVFTGEMLDILAEKIVGQVRLRGPFLSLSEFVNRKLAPVPSGKALADLTPEEKLVLAGAIQTALNELATEPGHAMHAALQGLSQVTERDPAGDDRYLFRAAAEGHSSYGLPGWIRQADVLRPLAPILSARDDTFTIRAYGDARDKAGNILAKAWCEATVRRTRDFIVPTDPADNIDTPAAPQNVLFGRRFAILSFRWLSPEEV